MTTEEITMKTAYEAPSCQTVALMARQAILEFSLGQQGQAGADQAYDEENEDY